MSILDTQRATALGVLDQDAFRDERAFGAGWARRFAMQANLMRDHPSIIGATAIPLGSSDDTSTSYRSRLDLRDPYTLAVARLPVRPAHKTARARVRLQLATGITARIGLAYENQRPEYSLVVGSGALSTEEVTTAMPGGATNARFRLVAQGISLVPATGLGVTNPYTYSAGVNITQSPDRALTVGTSWPDVIDSGGYYLSADLPLQPLWTRRILGRVAGNQGFHLTPPFSNQDWNAANRAGVTFTVYESLELILAGVTIRGEP